MVEQATHVFSHLRGESPFLTRSQCSIVQFWFLCIQKDLSFQTSCNLKDNIIAFKSLSPSGLHVVFLTLIPYSFHLFKGLVRFGNVLSAKFCHLEGNHDKWRYLFFEVVIKRQTFPYPIECAKDQRNLWGVDKRQFVSIFEGPLASPMQQESSYKPAVTPLQS